MGGGAGAPTIAAMADTTITTPHGLTQAALEAMTKGNYCLAWSIAREMDVFNIATVGTFYVLSETALGVGAFARAAAFAERGLDLSPRDKRLRATLERARGFATAHGPDARASDGPQPAPEVAGLARRHLIRAWGFGFCSEMDHVVGHLALAELEGRAPVVWWGQTSVFRDEGVENAWTRFFEPIGDLEQLKADLVAIGPQPGLVHSGKWLMDATDGARLIAGLGGLSRFVGDHPHSHMGSPLFINRPEPLTVGDFFVGPVEAIGWASPGMASARESLWQAYRRLVSTHIRPNAAARAMIESHASELGLGDPSRPTLAVHVRESDKILEAADIADRNADVLTRARAACEADGRLRVLLITDSVHAVARYRAALGGRVMCLDAIRTDTHVGVHDNDPSRHRVHQDRTRLGMEVVRDIYLAARCERFMGVGASNVAAMVAHLKDWPKDACVLTGDLNHRRTKMALHSASSWDS